jgi:hypothetical protein
MDISDLQLVLVRYGSDTGLVSLAARSILCHTVETNDGGLEWPKGLPVVDFSDESKFTLLLGQDPEEPDHDWDDVLRYVLDHARKLDLIKKPIVTRSYTRIVTMTVACLAEDAQDVKRSLFAPDDGECWYLNHNCPLGPIRVGIRLPTAAEEAAARDALDVDEEGEEQP